MGGERFLFILRNKSVSYRGGSFEASKHRAFTVRGLFALNFILALKNIFDLLHSESS